MEKQKPKPVLDASLEQKWHYEEWFERMGKTPRFLKSKSRRPPDLSSSQIRAD
jgi:hypothetical protein